MARYFFNTHNGRELFADGDGVELPNDAAARREAIQALAEMARDQLPNDGDRTDISIHVTDEMGRPLFGVRLDFHVDVNQRAGKSSS